MRRLSCLTLLSLLVVACGDPPVADLELEEDEESIRAPATAASSTRPSADACGNGLDDDGNGVVDDGCPCAAGATQSCFLGAVAQAGVGACVRGTQSCFSSGGVEFKTGTWGPCTGSGVPAAETCNGRDDDCNGKNDDLPAGGTCAPGGTPPGGTPQTPPPGSIPCAGVGLIFTSIGDKCIDDGGQSDEDDDLQVYCVNNITRFCLSKEACPWRQGTATPDTVTCSRAGLSGVFMSSARDACGVYQGKSRVCCDMSGKASFTGC